MELEKYFKAVLEAEQASVVLCNLEHKIVYMNPFAIKAYKRDLTGGNLMDCHNERSQKIINKVIEWFEADKNNNMTHEFYNEKQNKDAYMVALRDDEGKLIGYYEKHNYRTRDTSPFYEGIKID